ncbi:MAG TPA: GNAT family N-acetyltransferase [Bryobacteraceae bacterium]|nr:GNAT family N-acetyltransferase [Bryobacteraceae bacterium]
MIRRLRAEDVDSAMELSDAAGWNQTAADWRMLLELAPERCFCIDCDGRLAATATLLCYGRRLAWLGMVLTRPDYRRRGFARALVEHALDAADRALIVTVKLDATDQGRPLYASLGFHDEQPVERWLGAAMNGEGSPPPALSRFTEQLDREAFLADRSTMLRALAARGGAYSDQGGFLLTREGACASYLGPCVAERRETAESLIAAALTTRSGSWFWDLLPANAEAVALAHRFGFERVRMVTRMYRGRPLRGNEALAYGLAGFELG